MSLTQIISDFFRRLFARKTRDNAWNARFDQPSKNHASNLPLDPGKSEIS